METIKGYISDIKAQVLANKWWYIIAGGLILVAFFVGLAR